MALNGFPNPSNPFGPSYGVGSPGVQGVAPSATAFSYEQNPGKASNEWYGADPVAHNEAIYAWERESASAQAQREYEERLANTAMQRKVKDYMAAGFSPLAALENAGSNYVPSVAAASSQAASPRQSNMMGTMLGAVLAAIMAVATKGASSAVASGVAKKKAAQEFAQRVLAK